MFFNKRIILQSFSPKPFHSDILEWGDCPNGLSFPRAHGWGLNDVEKLLSCLVVLLSCRRAPPPAARDPPITRSDRFSQLLLHHEPAAATHPSQVQTSSVNCFYITDRPPRPILCKRRPIQSIALISRTARRDPPIASADQFSQWLLHHEPPAATHPSQVPPSTHFPCFLIIYRKTFFS